MTTNPFPPPCTPAEVIASRSGLYHLLSRLWIREVDEKLLSQLLSSPLCESFTEAGGILPTSQNVSESVEQLAIEYCRLFVGPTGHLPPCQSVWQEGQFQGSMIGSMENFCAAVDYDTSLLGGRNMKDHLGIQLDVMGHILDLLSQPTHQDESQPDLLAFAETFYQTHLTWATKLFAAVSQKTTTDFYRSVVLLTQQFLASEAAPN